MAAGSKFKTSVLLIALVSCLQVAHAKKEDNPGQGGGGGGVGGPPPTVYNDCQVTDVLITDIQNQGGGGTLPAPYPIPATSCIGDVEGNDSQGDLNGEDALGNSVYNLGYAGMGWLNDGNGTVWPNPGAFVTDDDLEDLAGFGKVDPGWIFFGKYDSVSKGSEEGSWQPSHSSKDGFGTYNYASDLLTLTCKDDDDNEISCLGQTKGSFTYKPPVTNPQQLMDMLGANKFFDQVAVIFKAGNAWAMYNFKLSALGLPPVIGTEDTNFVFSGEWDIGDTLGGHGLSHISMWGRDPTADIPDVPAPLPLGLVGVSLLILGLQRRSRRN